MAAALLIAALAAFAWFNRRTARAFAGFKARGDTHARRRVFLRWTLRSFALYAGMPLLGLLLLGRLDALWDFPLEFVEAALRLDAPAMTTLSGGNQDAYALTVLLATLAAMAVGAVLTWFRRKPPPTIGDIHILYPRNRAEALPVALLAINAGVSEEIFFRLYLPLLLTLAGMDALLAFALPIALFAWPHRYQGRFGMIVSALLGGVMTLLYLATFSLWLPILVHILLDLNGLVLRPAVRRLAERRRG